MPRILRTLGALRKPQSIGALASLGGVSEKTIRRDIAFLRKIGFDVRERVEEYGRKTYLARRVVATLKDLLGE